MRTGMQTADGLSIMAEGEADPARRELLTTLAQKTGAGVSVYAAMADSDAFPDYVLQMVKIGEVTGYLDNVLASLSRYCETRVRIAKALRSAVAYPAVLLAVMLVVLAVFLTRVLPIFDGVFRQLGATMSPLAAGLLRFGLGLRAARWWILGVIAVIVAAGLIIYLVPKLRCGFSGLVNRLFARTRLGGKIGAARFASALELAFSGGVELDRAMELAQHFCADPAMLARVESCRRRMAAGESMDCAFAAEKIFTPMCCGMLSVGVRTGTTDAVLRDVARRTGEDMDAAIDRAAATVEPVIVLILTVCVGLLLLAVMLPLVGIMSAI